jgi:hypothetical protein
MALSVITSRRWQPWPKIHWIVFRRELESKNASVTVDCEDYELVWPWMRCVGIGIHKGG